MECGPGVDQADRALVEPLTVRRCTLQVASDGCQRNHLNFTGLRAVLKSVDGVFSEVAYQPEISLLAGQD